MVDKKIKIYGVILGVVLFILLVVGFTYAALTWRSPNITITGNTECLDIDELNGEEINGEELLLLDESDIISNNTITIKKGMLLTSISAKLSNTCSINGYLTLYLNVESLSNGFTSEGNSTGALKYVVTTYDPTAYNEKITTNSLLNNTNNTFNILKTGTITSVSTTDTKIKLTDGANLSKNSYLSYIIIFYIDGDLAHNDIGGNNINFKATLEGNVTQGTLS